MRKRGYSQVLDNKVLGLISIVVIALSVAVTALYSHALLRYLFILLICIIVIVKRKYFVSALSKK